MVLTQTNVSALTNILDNMEIKISRESVEYLLNKAEDLFGTTRLLDGFLDMLDTVESFFISQDLSQINTSDLKEKDVEFIWEELYDA